MRSLFFKIFVSFWLTTILVGLTLEISNIMISREEAQWRDLTTTILPPEAKKAVAAFESSGPDGLKEAFDDLQQRKSIRGYMFDEHGKPILSSPAPHSIDDMRIVLATRNSVNHEDDGKTMANLKGANVGQLIVGPSGRRYMVILLFPYGGVSTLWRIFRDYPLLRILIILIVGGVFCLWLTRHITEPLVRLRAAASGLAEGRLDTRVGKTLGRRSDEIATLGRDFDRMAERLEALITAQRGMLGDVSHELRSPLARLIVALSLVRQSSPAEAPEYLDRIELEVARLDKLIGQLLTLSRIESGVDAGLRGYIDLTNLVEEIAADADFEGRAQDRFVKVCSAEPCTISGFEEMLRSAIENVVRNAIRHTRPRTTVEITLQKQELATSPRASLQVRDHGPGVSEEMLGEIFLPFRRAIGQAEAEAETGGAGLGLAITERVVTMHYGKVRAANAVGGGLLVEIELPLLNQAV